MGCCLPLIAGCGALGGSDDDDGSESDGGTSAATELTISVQPQGEGGPTREWTLRCEPTGGTLPGAEEACAKLTAEALEPLPPDTVCTQIYGGPQKAHVRGRIDGTPVDARFSRTNGCEIHRWDSVRFLFPFSI
jgi:Subtilisin inhibitor-like